MSKKKIIIESEETETTQEQEEKKPVVNNIVKSLVGDYYDIQKIRIELGNQINAFADGMSETEEEEVRTRFYVQLHNLEKDIVVYLQRKIYEEPIYTKWLKNVKGIGPILSAGLIAYIGDPQRFATISKLWKYSGYSVDENGRADKRHAGQKSNFNIRLKTHIWKIGESFVKTKGGYRELYDTFRKEYDEKWKTPEDCGSVGCKNFKKCLDGHRYAAAKRKTVKIFLAHLWMRDRELKGLPLELPYILGKEAHSHLIEIVEK